MRSKLGRLSSNDIIRTVAMLFVSTFVANVWEIIVLHRLPTKAELLAALWAGGISALAYLKLKLATNSEGKLLTKEPNV